MPAAFWLPACFFAGPAVLFLSVFSPAAAAAAPPLVLQYEVSHSRNTDQISLIFRQSAVELVANASSWQKGPRPRLGRFGSSMTPELLAIKKRAERFRARLGRTIPVSSLIKDPRFRPPPDPHGAVLRLGGEEIKADSPSFGPLIQIFRRAWQLSWTCLECAVYQKKGGKILRTARAAGSPGGGGLHQQGQKKNPARPAAGETKSFSKKALSCVPKSSGKIECVDPQFGIFEL